MCIRDSPATAVLPAVHRRKTAAVFHVSTDLFAVPPAFRTDSVPIQPDIWQEAPAEKMVSICNRLPQVRIHAAALLPAHALSGKAPAPIPVPGFFCKE